MILATGHDPNRHLSWLNNQTRQDTVLDSKDISKLKPLQKDQFEVLHQISRTLNTANYEESLIGSALDMAIDFIHADRGLFCRYNREEDNFKLVVARNLEQNGLENLESFSSGVLGRVVKSGRTCLYHDAQQDPDISQYKSIQIHNIKSIIGVPVFQQEQIWGVILLDSQTDRHEFKESNLAFLEFFASLLSLVLEKVIFMESLQEENILLKKQLEESESLPEMIGQSRSMRDLARLIRKVAQTTASVLILGESGTGKELVARAIHMLSPRKDQPFIAQFCGSIPDTLLESELFGYKKGAFTGASNDKKGLFEVADQGTFFLDEIADISLSLQAKLLRILENQEIIPLGDTRIRKINVRIIAATNKDLNAFVRDGKFREDLFYRLNVFPVVVPPLRDRADDIPLLIRHFISQKHGRKLTIDKTAVKTLQSYHWPGNVRQLENVLQRAIILSDDNAILAEHIILSENEEGADFGGTLKDYELMLLKNRLKQFDGNRTLTARSLGVSVRWVQIKLKEAGIS